MPSFLASEAKGMLPIVLQNMVSIVQGEMDGFDALSSIAGFDTSTSYPREFKPKEPTYTDFREKYGLPNKKVVQKLFRSQYPKQDKEKKVLFPR
jgi:hypothetical protein